MGVTESTCLTLLIHLYDGILARLLVFKSQVSKQMRNYSRRAYVHLIAPL